jgi:hypothetical protein
MSAAGSISLSELARPDSIRVLGRLFVFVYLGAIAGVLVMRRRRPRGRLARIGSGLLLILIGTLALERRRSGLGSMRWGAPPRRCATTRWMRAIAKPAANADEVAKAEALIAEVDALPAEQMARRVGVAGVQAALESRASVRIPSA